MSKIFFLHPEYLYFLIALILPLIIHLFNFRKVRKILFTNTKYLKEIEQKQESFSKLKRYLLLFSRMSAILFLVLALAGPYLGSSDVKLKKIPFAFLDNSLSMQYTRDGISLLDHAKTDIIESFREKSTEYFYLASNNSFDIINDELSLKLALSSINYSKEALSTDVVKARIEDVSKREKNELDVFLFSDLKFENNNFKNDTTVSDRPYSSIHYIADNHKNVSIDSVWISSIKYSDESVELSYRLRSFFSSPIEINEQIRVDSNIISSLTRTIKAKSDTVLSLKSRFPNSKEVFAEIQIRGDEVEFDNSIYFSLDFGQKLKVLHKGDGNTSVLDVLQHNSNLDISFCNDRNFKNFNLNDFDFLVYTITNNYKSDLKSILEFNKQGKNILLLPSQNITKNIFNGLLNALGIKARVKNSYVSKSMTSINYDSYILSDVFEKKVLNFAFPEISKGFNITSSKAENLLGLESGESLLFEYKNNVASYYVYSSSIFEIPNTYVNTNYATAIYYKLASSKTKGKLYYTIGKDWVYNNFNDDNLHISSDGFYADLYPIGNNEFLIQHINSTGNFKLFNEKEAISNISFNHSRDENFHEIDSALERHFIITLDELKNQDKLIYLWKWCLTFTLIFLLMEFLVINLLKD